MDIDLAKWKCELKVHQQNKHLVHWKAKPHESVFNQCFLRMLDPNRHVIPLMFATNRNLYKPTGS